MSIDSSKRKWNVTYHSSIGEIPEADWNNCAGSKNPFVQHQHLNALEESGLVSLETGFEPQHIVLRDGGGRAIAAAPVYLKMHSKGELGVDLGLAMAHERAVGPYYPKLQVEVPFTPISGSRLLIRPGADKAAVGLELVGALKKRAIERHASSAQISYMSIEDNNHIGQSGFITTEGNAYIWKAKGIKSFDEFLSKMRSKSRSKILSERRKSTASDLCFKTFTGNEVTSDLASRFFELYKSTFERNATDVWLNLRYFEILFETMQNYLEIVIAFDESTWVAAQLDIVTPDIRFAQHWGHMGSIPYLLFEMGIYQTIEHAIAANQDIVNFGTTGLHKSERGIDIEPTHHAMWFAEPAFIEIAEVGLTRKRESARQERLAEAKRLPLRQVSSIGDD
ncbi:MAG: GNAT family N-acetyltransferase [Sneathiella sp.]|nr:GNAT family N-acetyltransferase [Sneathiella sp.]